MEAFKLELLEQLIDDLISSFELIEKARSYSVNKGGKPKMSKEKNADLYFAGDYLIKNIRSKGTIEQKQRLDNIISSYEKYYH